MQDQLRTVLKGLQDMSHASIGKACWKILGTAEVHAGTSWKVPQDMSHGVNLMVQKTLIQLMKMMVSQKLWPEAWDQKRNAQRKILEPPSFISMYRVTGVVPAHHSLLQQ